MTEQTAADPAQQWATDPRWAGVERTYTAGDVVRLAEGLHRVRPGIESAISRGRAHAPHADLLWLVTGTPCLQEARRFAAAIHASHPAEQFS